MEQDGYTTLSAGTTAAAEHVVSRSRFLAQLRAVASPEDAEALVAEARATYHDARHHVFAWILADGRERYSDDGEPQRTAGVPVLEVLRGAGLANVCCVVTRYFGGTLLGAGGLVRAYTTAAQEAVEAARAAGQLVQMRLVVNVVACIPYAAYERVLRLVEAAGGRVKDSLFREDVQLTCVFAAGAEDVFVESVCDLFAGEDVCRVGELYFGEL